MTREDSVRKMRMKALVGSVRKVVNHIGEASCEEVSLQAVYNDGGVNASWCKWTPSINFNFTISNPAAFGLLHPGDFYYIDLVPTTKDEPIGA